jgi:hypothetical protein
MLSTHLYCGLVWLCPRFRNNVRLGATQAGGDQQAMQMVVALINKGKNLRQAHLPVQRLILVPEKRQMEAPYSCRVISPGLLEHKIRLIRQSNWLT